MAYRGSRNSENPSFLLCLFRHVLLLTCSEVSLSTNQIVFLSGGNCDVFSWRPVENCGRPLGRCVVRQLWWSVLEWEFSARFFKAAQSAGFDNFQAFVWYNQGKWPLEPSKVKKCRLSLLVSKHAVLLRRVGTTSNIRWLWLERLLCKRLNRSLLEIFLWLNNFSYVLTVSRKLPPPEQDGRTVSNIVGFLELKRFVFSWPIVVHFK